MIIFLWLIQLNWRFVTIRMTTVMEFLTKVLLQIGILWTWMEMVSVRVIPLCHVVYLLLDLLRTIPIVTMLMPPFIRVQQSLVMTWMMTVMEP